MSQLTTKIDKQFLGRLCADAISNLQKACENHPTFPGTFTDLDIEQSQELMYGLKSLNDNGLGDASTIAQEEQMELECAVTQGMRAQAYDELVDLITVWLRVGLHLDDYVTLTAAQEPQINPEEAASQEETSSELNRHEVQPRLGFEKGVAP